MYKFNNRTAAKLLCVIIALLCCIVPLGFNAFAADNTAKLTSDSKATITLNYPQAAAEKVFSMQISLQVTPHNAKVEFVPDIGLKAKVVEYRHHSDTGILNIYLAGTEPLFPESGVLTPGSVKLSVSESGTATVDIVENSVKFVRSGKLDDSYLGSASWAVQQDDPAKPIESDSLPTQPSNPTSTPTQPSNPTSTPTQPSNPTSTPTQPSNPTSTPTKPNNPTSTPTQPSNPTSTPTKPNNPTSTPTQPSNPTSTPVGDNFNPLDTSALSVALSKAINYKRGDYTESSYAVLAEAIDNANALISDPNATQDMIDEALLILENAIGMLTYSNQASQTPTAPQTPPSANNSNANSSESSSASTLESSDSNSSSNESSKETSDENSADSTDSTDDQSSSSNTSQSSDSSQSSDAENDDSNENTFPVWGIVLIVVGVVIVTVVIILVVKLKNKTYY